MGLKACQLVKANVCERFLPGSFMSYPDWYPVGNIDGEICGKYSDNEGAASQSLDNFINNKFRCKELKREGKVYFKNVSFWSLFLDFTK